MSLNPNFSCRQNRLISDLQKDVNRKAEIITKLNKRIAELENRFKLLLHITKGDKEEVKRLDAALEAAEQRIAELEAIPRD